MAFGCRSLSRSRWKTSGFAIRHARSALRRRSLKSGSGMFSKELAFEVVNPRIMQEIADGVCNCSNTFGFACGLFFRTDGEGNLPCENSVKSVNLSIWIAKGIEISGNAVMFPQ